jgi:hypothetical protein
MTFSLTNTFKAVSSESIITDTSEATGGVGTTCLLITAAIVSDTLIDI